MENKKKRGKILVLLRKLSKTNKYSYLFILMDQEIFFSQSQQYKFITNENYKGHLVKVQFAIEIYSHF